MSGDWIKMRVDLQSHPKVVRILSATKSDKFRAIGGLHAVWSVFDAHSEDGKLSGYTPELMDHIIGWQGFSRAMESVGWLIYDGLETLSMPDFTEHNGQSAKRRAEDQKRKRNERRASANCPKNYGQIEDEVRTREEKRREEINIYTPEFERFWNAWPSGGRKGGRKNAYMAWKKHKLDDHVDQIISHVNSDIAKREEQYRPAPASYLNKMPWDGWEGDGSNSSMFDGVI